MVMRHWSVPSSPLVLQSYYSFVLLFVVLPCLDYRTHRDSRPPFVGSLACLITCSVLLPYYRSTMARRGPLGTGELETLLADGIPCATVIDRCHKCRNGTASSHLAVLRRRC